MNSENKNTKSVQDIIQYSSYNIKLNDKIITAIERFCIDNNKNENFKSKMMIMTSLIYWKQILRQQSFAEISSNLLKKMFGRYSEILKACLKVSINQVGNYSTTAGYCKSYAIRNNLFDKNVLNYYPNLSKNQCTKIKSIELKRVCFSQDFGSFYGDDRVKLQNDFLMVFRESIKENYKKELKNLENNALITKEQRKRDEALFTSFIENGEHFTSTPDHSGRVYNVFSMCKRESRVLLGKDWIEIDISNSHPFILSKILNDGINGALDEAGYKLVLEQLKEKFSTNEQNKLEYEKYKTSIELAYEILTTLCKLKGKEQGRVIINYYSNIYSNYICDTLLYKDLQEELDSLLCLTSKQVFYETVADKMKVSGHKFEKIMHLLKDDIPHYKSIAEPDITNEMKRAAIKVAFMFWLNGTAQLPNGTIRAQKKPFVNAFPLTNILFCYLKLELHKQYKQYKILGNLIKQIEANFIFKIVYKLKGVEVKAGSLHDAIFIEKKNQLKTLNVIQQLSKEYFGTEIKLKIKQL